MMNRVKRRLADYQADHHVSVYAYQEQWVSRVESEAQLATSHLRLLITGLAEYG